MSGATQPKPPLSNVRSDCGFFSLVLRETGELLCRANGWLTGCPKKCKDFVHRDEFKRSGEEYVARLKADYPYHLL